MSKRLFFAIAAITIAAVAHGAEVTLDSLAVRYGELMVRHWLTEDIARQIERGASYRSNSVQSKISSFNTRVTDAEKQLTDARALYGKLYRKETQEPIGNLERLLNEAADAENRNATNGINLLQEIGVGLSGRSFRALPVGDKDLGPAWDAEKDIDKQFKPQRILFGSTGQVADNRTLPLGFDFQSGIYSFNIPMSGPGRLDISDALRNRTASYYPWMRDYHCGYHYWAGVYNNQNTAVSQWFFDQHAKDDDVWMRLADGKIPSRGTWAQVNIWNPAMREYLRDYCATQARTFAEDPFLVCYDYTAEPHPWGSQPPGQAQYSGYNDSAIAAFRKYLQQKFHTIAELNKAWHTNYGGFDAINPPPDPYVVPRPKATPLTFEFEEFRWESHTELWKSLYDAYRQNDPRKPVVANISQYMSGWPLEALDAYGMQKAGVADWIDMHMNNFPPNLAEQIYLYSLCRLTGKVPVQFEYIWTFPRTGPVDQENESDFRATCLGSVWRNLVWGKKAMVFFDFYYDWPAYHNAFFDQALGYSILRPSACVVPVTKRKALRFSDILLNTEVTEPPIAVLQPTTSVMSSPPLHPNQSFSYHINVAQNCVHPLLFSKNYPFLYVPEEAVLNDGYDLNKHKVLVLPEAPYLPQRMTDILLKWVKRGGTLITLGPPGLWTPYGEDDGRILKTVLGRSDFIDAEPGQWKWKTGQGDFKPTVKSYGKGRVLLSLSDFNSAESKPLFYETVDKAIGMRPAFCEKDQFELVLREDAKGHRYLFVLNPHTRERRRDRITIAGRYKKCSDLGVGSGVPLSAVVKGGATSFDIFLHPGEGTVISLR